MDIAANITDVQRRIEAAAAKVGRSSDDVLLIAVSKTYTHDVIQQAYDAGLRHFGENRVEEAIEKITQSQLLMPDATWHMIGTIQSRKTADVASAFHYAHSVDRLKIARRLSESAAESNRVLDVLLEINVSGEASKSGYVMSNWSVDKQAFEILCADITAMRELSGIRLQGLMTMAPYSDNPEDARPVFRQLRDLKDTLCGRISGLSLPHLSMGMSGDYEVAIEEGATMVRVGTAIFGVRVRA